MIGIYGYFTGASYEEMKSLLFFVLSVIILSRIYKLEKMVRNTEVKVEVHEIAEEDLDLAEQEKLRDRKEEL